MRSHELWQAVLGELELKLSKANFTTWFKNTFITKEEETEITIAVPSAFIKTWIEKKYAKDILNTLQLHARRPIRTVHFLIETRATPIFSSSQPPLSQEKAPEMPVSQEKQPILEEVAETELTLNPKYLFSNLIIGKQNEMAHAAAEAVADKPGTTYNPLFIYGGVGLGKTHLLQAIGNEARKKNPKLKVLYVTSERFTNEFIHALRIGKAKEFKDVYRNVDILLIDDIQFITGKEGTQEEFFHTFNHLHQNNKQIVLSSDRPPKAIPSIEQRLLSRFEWGMMADVGSPDFETRIAILDAKCREKGWILSSEILHHIATSIQSNVRELEGALNKIIAFHDFKSLTPTLETISPMLQSFQPARLHKNLTAKHLISTVSLYYDVPLEDLLGKSREKRLAFPRQVIMFLMREEMKSSFPSIGSELGGRDHTTAMHACEKIGGLCTRDEKTRQDVETLREKIYTTMTA